MPIPQVDYAGFAETFDKTRSLAEAKQILWRRLFEKHLGLNAASRLLDVGCGTGRFSTLIAQQFKCAVVGIDPSASMLAKAKAKCYNGVEWTIGRAEAMPFADGVFDACLASQVIHHFQDQRRAFAEMYRVLAWEGRLGIRHSSHAQLETILDYRFFPSALQIDLERLPDIGVLKDLMHTCGFRLVTEHVVCQQLFESADDYLAKLRSKYASVLSLISKEEYQKGLNEAEAYFETQQLHKDDKYACITFLVGAKTDDQAPPSQQEINDPDVFSITSNRTTANCPSRSHKPHPRSSFPRSG
ncbi:MAG: methyltransferase domain-containing protein [Anaerolineae bacterium]|nr:methyltransferase domain-containing protein [Anaerolineae bacterium]